MLQNSSPTRRPSDRGAVESTRVLGTFLRDVMAENMSTFRVFAPDENNSNRLNAVLEVTDRTWNAGTIDSDDGLAPDGRVMEVLSEHLCQRSEEHTSELQSLMRISYAVFCLKK